MKYLNINPDHPHESGTPRTGPHKVQMDAWISAAPFERLLGMEILEAENGHALLTMPVLYDFVQGGGLLHGGALVSLADTAVAMAIKSILPPQTHFGTISMESTFCVRCDKGSSPPEHTQKSWKAESSKVRQRFLMRRKRGLWFLRQFSKWQRMPGSKE